MISAPDPERARPADADAGRGPWPARRPYLAERAWGTVREDSHQPGWTELVADLLVRGER